MTVRAVGTASAAITYESVQALCWLPEGEQKCRPCEDRCLRQIGSAYRSWTSQSVMRTQTNSPGSRFSPAGMITRPSISGASPGEQARRPLRRSSPYGHLAADVNDARRSVEVFWNSHQLRRRRSSQFIALGLGQTLVAAWRTFDRRVGEGARVELGFFEKLQQLFRNRHHPVSPGSRR